MNLPKRTVYASLLALVCANILVRFPTSYHETGVDSFFVHNLATAISDQGRIAYVVNPLGYFGWYPLSYPSASPLLISGLAQTSGLSEEGAILALSIFYGVFGALAAFVMARAFRKDDAFALLAAMLFSLAPRFISFTLWTASARSLFMLLVPVFVWLLVRAYLRPNPANLAFLTSLLAVLIATHRLTILLAVVVIAFVAAYVFLLMNRVMRIRFPRVLLSKHVRTWTPVLALLGILAIAAYMVVGTHVLGEYATGEVCAGTSFGNEVCNLGVSVTRSVGLALPFGLLGVVEVVRQNRKGFLEAFLVFSLLALLPTLFLRQYTGFYILPFISLFGAYGILALIRILPRHRIARNALIVASVLAINGFSLAVLQVEVERQTVITSATYSAGLYMKSLPPGNFVGNEGLMAVRVSAVSGRQALPVGGSGTTSQSPEVLIMGAYNATELFGKERRIPLTSLTIEDDSPFYLVSLDARHDWIYYVMRRSVDSVPSVSIEGVSIFDRYHLQYYLESDSIPNGYSAFGNSYGNGVEVVFTNSVHAERFKVFDGSVENIYLVFPPS